MCSGRFIYNTGLYEESGTDLQPHLLVFPILSQVHRYFPVGE